MTAKRILVLIPHPDDEVVGCAAAIRRAAAAGARVFGLYLTTGVPPAELLWRQQRRHHPMRVIVRRLEARDAAAALGLEPVGFAERPARRLRAELGAALGEIEAALSRVRADELWVSAWEGGHQDHDAANFLAARCAGRVPVLEYAEYNNSAGVRSQAFAATTGAEIVLRLDREEQAEKRRLLAFYRSERRNLAHVERTQESLRPLPAHDYAAPPHPGTLFAERFHWVPFRHPRIDFERHETLRAALADFARGSGGQQDPPQRQ
ncbi:MAG TPA: PIG-L family deacetylase [Stellaceae bacterium]|jgi:LmbE family N-acetylglucosaminyl deacetylase|nr:PIG-L family deacetylase [Stellaceae bacterium]